MKKKENSKTARPSFKHEVSWETSLNEAHRGNVILSRNGSFYLAASADGRAISGKPDDKFILDHGESVTLADAKPEMFDRVTASAALELVGKSSAAKTEIPTSLPLDAEDVGFLVAGSLRRGLTPREGVAKFIEESKLHDVISDWS